MFIFLMDNTFPRFYSPKNCQAVSLTYKHYPKGYQRKESIIARMIMSAAKAVKKTLTSIFSRVATKKVGRFWNTSASSFALDA